MIDFDCCDFTKLPHSTKHLSLVTGIKILLAGVSHLNQRNYRGYIESFAVLSISHLEMLYKTENDMLFSESLPVINAKCFNYIVVNLILLNFIQFFLFRKSF